MNAIDQPKRRWRDTFTDERTLPVWDEDWPRVQRRARILRTVAYLAGFAALAVGILLAAIALAVVTGMVPGAAVATVAGVCWVVYAAWTLAE